MSAWLPEAAPLAVAPPSELLHGLALRPPEAAWDGSRYRGSALDSVRLDEARAQAGVVAVVRRENFAGVVAVTPLHARQALASLAPAWRGGGRPAQEGLAESAGTAPADEPEYLWRPAAAAASARVAAWCLEGRLTLWLPPDAAALHALARRELAALFDWPECAVTVAAWPQGAAPAAHAAHALDLLDAAAEAALLSEAVARPVCVASRPPLPATLALRAADLAAGPVLCSPQPWAMRPSLARLLARSGPAPASGHATVLGDGPVRAQALSHALLHASVDELNAAQVFAGESLWHERALAAGEDPVDWRLRHLADARGRELARQVVEQAAMDDAAAPRDGLLRGSGFATAQVRCEAEDGSERMVWSAWVAEVAIQPATGAIEVTRVVAGHDSQDLRPAQGATTRLAITRQQPERLAEARRLIGAPAAFDDWRAATPAAANGATDALAMAAPTPPDVVRAGRLDLDGVATLPAAAAIANAIADATGVRLRQAPFDAGQLRLALADRRAARRGALRRGWGWLAAGAASVATLATALWPLKPALPLTAGPDPSLYSAQAIERGRLVAAAGDCVACHTAPGGARNAGGLALETPFGTIYSTNITPDPQTGIGRWSFAAFERAMRQGVHQDGRQLYPAFPYTAYAKLSDADMQALYGYLMSQPAVAATPPRTELGFPFNLRPLLAGWNLLFHDPKPFTPDPSQDAEWNRGAYLVEGVGHCAACHSPRNALGAEKGGLAYLAGGQAEGWNAPALNQLATGERAWSDEELFQYLRTGYSPRHGVAAGPMAPVIHGLAELPASDLKAIVTYLMAVPGRTPSAARATATATATASAATSASVVSAPAATTATAAATNTAVSAPAAVSEAITLRRASGERIYQNACAVCHEAGSGPTLFGVKPLLGQNTNLHAASPDNLIQVILHGIQAPADDALGYMPSFGNSLDDRQIGDLIDYLRARFAPEEEAWPVDTTTIGKLRQHAQPQ
ncbi:c-type cytochrome [Achromobacter xylosoxidans]|uniref:c-type cytochrome n=1 Tax=Alcaligenes xylosoxydans xylosoxydans TaxID=85698 RepID=UPI001F134B5E|nr:c-type cytochrome [Achromobacter xylosoxidans]